MDDIDERIATITEIMGQGQPSDAQQQQAAAAIVGLVALVVKDVRRIADALTTLAKNDSARTDWTGPDSARPRPPSE